MTSRRLTTVLKTVLVAGLLPLALTACGSGRSPETYAERATVDAANASAGDLELRNVSIDPPEGDDVELAVGAAATATASIVNLGEAPDRLVSVSTQAATSVELVDADGAVLPRLDVPPLGALDASDFSLALRGLTRAIRPGQHVQLTFTFSRGGRHTLNVPVAVYTSPAPRPTEDVFHIEEGGGEAGEQDTAEG